MLKRGLKKVTKPLFNFGNDDDDEGTKIPENAKLSRNIGWQTETSSGPNSFGKSKTGFTAVANPNRLTTPSARGEYRPQVQSHCTNRREPHPFATLQGDAASQMAPSFEERSQAVAPQVAPSV